jgi:hypothetical protein
MSKIKVFAKDGTDLYELDDAKEIARGGEGFLLPIPKNKQIVAKIYHPGCVSITEQKFSYLNKLDDKFFIKPLQLLYDKKKQICGITMNFLSNDFYPLDSIFNKNFCLKNGINFKIKEDIAKKLILAVESAHKIQVNIGDLSGLNVMMNNHGEIRLIDVDSYEVPGVKHTNKLLEEIRDYLYGGHVCSNSDFFAVSVVIFNYFTFLHPFKGVHRKIPKMAERMIRKLPVFVKDPDLITPKCFEPITDSYLQAQFERLYIKGERFLISVDKLAHPVIGKKVAPQTVTEGEVMLQNLLTGVEIEYAYFNDVQGMVRTKDEYLIYDCSVKSSIYLKARLKRAEYLDVFIGNENIILVKGNRLYQFDKSSQTTTEIVNFDINPKAKFIHMGNFIMMLEEDYMYKINLDEIKFKNIGYKRQDVYGPGFLTHNGLIQNVGGIYYVHYNIGNQLSISQSPTTLKGVYQRKDIGIAQFVENQQVKFKYYNINNLKFTFYQETDGLSHFAYRGNNLNDANIFQPKDNMIEVLRGLDLYKIAEIKCNLIATDTRLYSSNAGIIAVNEDEAWLINKR